MNETHLSASDVVPSGEQTPELAHAQFQQEILTTNPEYAPDVVALFAKIQNSGALSSCDLESNDVKTEAYRLIMAEIHNLLEQGKTPEKTCKIIPKKLTACIVNAREKALDQGIEDSQQSVSTRQNNIGSLEQRTLVQAKTIKTHEKSGTLKEKNAEIANLHTLVEDHLKSLPSGRLGEYRENMAVYLSAPEQGLGQKQLKECQDLAQQKFDEHEANLQQIEGVFTPEEVDTLFAGSVSANVMLDLSASEPMAVYSDVFARIEQSDLPPERKEALRQSTMNVLGQIDREIDTGTEVVRGTTQMVIDQKTGKKVPAHTKDRPLDLGYGVQSYTRTGHEVILKADVGGHVHTADVTGWSPQAVGSYTEALKFWAATESFGATGFVESVYKVDFSVLGNSVLDPFQMVEIKQKISYLMGGFEAYDGDIFDPSEKKGLIQAQMRALSPNDTALGWENDQGQTQEITKNLALDNPLVLKEFGAFTQAHYLTGDITHESLHAHLYKRFPQFVAKPELEAA